MGLLNNIRKSVGRVSNRAGSALGGLITRSGGGMLLKKAGVAGGAPGMALSAGVIAGQATKKLTGINFAHPLGGMELGRRIAHGLGFGKKAKIPVASAQAKKKSKLPTALKIGGGIALAGAGLYLGEQLAEKLGVRGGAGFIGARRRRKARRKYAYIRVQRNRRGKGKLTRNEESRLRSLARTYANSEGNSSRRKRRGKGKSMKNYMKWVRSFRGKKKRR